MTARTRPARRTRATTVSPLVPSAPACDAALAREVRAEAVAVAAGLAAGAPPIAASRDAAPHYGYTPELVLGGRRARRRYAAYVEGARRRLERLRPGQFRPDLRLYDELLGSLEIRK